MRILPTLQLVPAMLLLAGCAHQQLADKCVIYENEIAGWRKSALDAINSPEEWMRVGVRISSDPIPSGFADSLIYIMDHSRPDIVEALARLPMEPFQEEPYRVRVTMGRSSACVLSMREEHDRPVEARKGNPR